MVLYSFKNIIQVMDFNTFLTKQKYMYEWTMDALNSNINILGINNELLNLIKNELNKIPLLSSW